MKIGITLASILLLVTTAIFCSCKSTKNGNNEDSKSKSMTAKVTYWTIYCEDSYVDVNGNRPEPQESEHKTITVKKGNEVANMTVTKVTDKDITVESEYIEYYDPRDQKHGKTFTIKRGETVRLSVYGLLDASSTLHIAVK